MRFYCALTNGDYVSITNRTRYGVGIEMKATGDNYVRLLEHDARAFANAILARLGDEPTVKTVEAPKPTRPEKAVILRRNTYGLHVMNGGSEQLYPDVNAAIDAAKRMVEDDHKAHYFVCTPTAEIKSVVNVTVDAPNL